MFFCYKAKTKERGPEKRALEEAIVKTSESEVHKRSSRYIIQYEVTQQRGNLAGE